MRDKVKTTKLVTNFFQYILILFMYYSLKTGYVYEPDGTIHSLQKCDLELYQHGERGIPTRDYAFSFSAGILCLKL